MTQALERRDLDHQLARYAPHADIRVVDPDNPPVAPRMVRGTTAIHAWLLECGVGDLDLESPTSSTEETASPSLNAGTTATAPA